MHFNFDNTYARELEGFYIPWQGAEVPAPAIVKVNEALAHELQLDPCALQTGEGAAILAGARSPADATPLAQVYAGHQFGGFSPRLGDGRALLVGELIDRDGQRRDLHLKGSGRTPFSRGGDGKAVLGPVLREYLMGEAIRLGHSHHACTGRGHHGRKYPARGVAARGCVGAGGGQPYPGWHLSVLCCAG